MNDALGGESDSADGAERTARLIGIGVAVVDVPVFAYVCLLLFGEPGFGAAVGLVTGVGTYLFLPAAIVDDRGRTDDGADPTDVGARLRRLHRTAAGLALLPAGILLLSWRFVSENLLTGALATLVIAAVIYLSLAVLLPPRLS